MNSIDLVIFQSINQFAGKWTVIDLLGVFFASKFEYLLLLLIVLYFLSNPKKNFLAVAQIVAAVALSRGVIATLLKALIHRPRPFISDTVNLLIPPPSDFSFPSGHACFYFAISTVVYSYNKKAGIFFFISSALITISRVFVGVHWPLDIIGGAVVGVTSGIIIVKLFERCFPRGKFILIDQQRSEST